MCIKDVPIHICKIYLQTLYVHCNYMDYMGDLTCQSRSNPWRPHVATYKTKGFISNALMLDTTGTCPPEAICLRLDQLELGLIHCAAVIDHNSLGTPHAVDAQSDLDEENFEARSTL